MGARTIVRGTVTAATALLMGSLTLGTAIAAPAQAASAGRSAGSADTAVVSAMRRDLGLSASQAMRMLRDQTDIAQINTQIIRALGDAYAGSWFDRASGKLVVASTSAAGADAARTPRTSARVVRHSMESLTAIKAELDSLVLPSTRGGPTPPAESRARLAGAVSWSVDVRHNQLLVEVRPGQGSRIAAMLARHGDAVRIQETNAEPQRAGQATDATPAVDATPTAALNLAGGDPFDGCSVGFNVTKGGTGHLLSAGHCGQAGDLAVSRGAVIGPYVEAWFPTYDDALIRNDHPESWTQGPWVNSYSSDPNAYYIVAGYKDSPVGSSVCMSGRSSHVTCGTIRARSVTVNYSQGAVDNLIQHTACYVPGDGGGPLFSSGGDRIYAEGLTSGGVLSSGKCLGQVGGQSVTYSEPVSMALSYYGATLMTA